MKHDLQPLVTILGNKAYALYVGRDKRTFCAHLELTKIAKTADSAIRGFCALIEALPKAERDLWNGAKVRDFNVGVQAAAQPHCCEFAVAAETVRSVSKLGARIVFTVYAPDEPRKQATSTPH